MNKNNKNADIENGKEVEKTIPDIEVIEVLLYKQGYESINWRRRKSL